MNKLIDSEGAMKQFGVKLGSLLQGGEVIEMVGDVGAGKTTFAKGIAEGFGVTEDVQSPSFTISRVYDARDGLLLAHYDFYRLNDAGIMTNELHETAHDPKFVTMIEWADVVSNVLPQERLMIHISTPAELERVVTLTPYGKVMEQLVSQL